MVINFEAAIKNNKIGIGKRKKSIARVFLHPGRIQCYQIGTYLFDFFF